MVQFYCILMTDLARILMVEALLLVCVCWQAFGWHSVAVVVVKHSMLNDNLSEINQNVSH